MAAVGALAAAENEDGLPASPPEVREPDPEEEAETARYGTATIVTAIARTRRRAVMIRRACPTEVRSLTFALVADRSISEDALRVFIYLPPRFPAIFPDV